MLQGCYRFLLMDVYAGVLLQDLGDLQGCNNKILYKYII